MTQEEADKERKMIDGVIARLKRERSINPQLTDDTIRMLEKRRRKLDAEKSEQGHIIVP